MKNKRSENLKPFSSDQDRQKAAENGRKGGRKSGEIRIEAREARDLLQDLRDVAEGLEVVHASDMEKAKTQAKRNARTKRAAEKQKRMEKNHRKAFEEHWRDPQWKRALQNWFGAEYDSMIREKQDELVGVGAQLSLFPEL